MMSARETKGNPTRQTMEEIVSGKKEEPSADDDPDPAGWVKTSYTYDITAPYYEVLTETTNDVTTAYDYGVERLSSYYGSSAWNTIKNQYVYDGRGSVAQELSNNDSWYTFGGALAKRTKTSYSYTPFGELLDSSTAKTTNYAYNGESYDSAKGMVNLRARWYEPSTMRFSQRDTWSGKLEMPTTENRYLYCMNDPIGYYDRGGDRADEGSGVPKKVTPSTSAKKVVATPKTPTPTPTPKTTPLPQPAPSPDTKLNANTSAKKSGSGWVKTLIGALTVTACVAIVVFSGGTATPVMTPLAAWGLAFATGVSTGIVYNYGNDLMHQVDQTESFKEASDNAAKNTTNALPYIIGGSALSAGAAAYTSTLTGGQIPSLGLKPTPFATGAFDDAVDDASGSYSGQQAAGATQSGSAGTTACNETGYQSVNTSSSKTLSSEEAEEIAFKSIKGKNNSDAVVLGKYGDGGASSYVNVAKSMDAQYMQIADWDRLASVYDDSELWKINEKFLDIETSSGRDILLSHNPVEYWGGSSFYSKEIDYLAKNGYEFIKEGDVWRAIR